MCKYKYDGLTIIFEEYKENRFTACKIIESLDRFLDKEVYRTFIGIARLRPNDTPNQHEAQKISLGRALKNAGFSQEYRKKVDVWWEQEYQKRHKDDNHKPKDGKYWLKPDDVMRVGDIICDETGNRIDEVSFTSGMTFKERSLHFPRGKKAYRPTKQSEEK